MQINDLRLFLEISELGSFTKVAVQRNTAQSYISRQVSEMEKSCGGILFRRTGRGVVLTEFGEHVRMRVTVWLKASDELFADIQEQMSVGAQHDGLHAGACCQPIKPIQRARLG